MEYSEWRRQLIEGVREKYGEGYKVYDINKRIHEVLSVNKREVYIVEENLFEDMLLEDCKSKIIEFSESEQNKDVYAIVIEVDTDVGQIGISINSISGFENSIAKKYLHYSKEELYSIWGVKYNPGDFSFRFFDNLICNPQLKEILDAYYCISNEHPIQKVSKTIAFRSSFFDNALALIGINIIKRLEATFKKLNVTYNFIAYVSLGDMDTETIIALMKKTISIDRLKKIFPEVKL